MPTQEETLSHLISQGYLHSPKIIEAMEKIRREDFLPPEMRRFAWDDHPLPIGFGQTISAPHMYAFMLEAANVKPGDNVLEIGTGSGYGAALLSFLCGKKGKVTSIERISGLVEFAEKNLEKCELRADVLQGDGSKGYDKNAPYDKIIVTAACDSIPPALVEQLKTGGKLLIPVGIYFQDLILVEKSGSGIKETALMPVIFVPLVKD